jgi:RNA polymerase sigma-70 factor (ECF subfamily)
MDCITAPQTAAPSGAIDFDAAVEEQYEALYRFALGLSGSASDAADLTQETYRVLLLKADQIHNPERLKHWLFTTLYRQFLRGRHHLSRFPETELTAAADELPTVSAATVEALDAGVVLTAVQSLEDKYRAAITLFYLDDLSYKEIAEVLNVPIGTVMSRLSRGKALLRRELAGLFTSGPTDPGPPSRNRSMNSNPTRNHAPGALRAEVRPGFPRVAVTAIA